MLWAKARSESPPVPPDHLACENHPRYTLRLWRESEPEAPDGPWYKDFGSFKICGQGEFSKTFLLKGHAAKGESL